MKKNILHRGLSSGGFVELNIDDYLTIEALEDGLTASLSINTCEYCVDFDGNWKSLTVDTATEAINTGQTLSFRGNLTPNSSNGIGTFTINKKCNLKGNCMSILFGDIAAYVFSLRSKSYAFYKLFYNCANIVNVSSNFLPATTLAKNCYERMFYGCTNLTTTPALLATNLEVACYRYMFTDCTNLITVPSILPSTTLAYHCYANMFSGCTSLTTTPVLPATRLTYSCYSSMFFGCKSLTTAPELPATALGDYCYCYMFYNCTNLSTAPELPATTLAKWCYADMFSGCKSLTTAPELPATTLTESCYYHMFSGCTSLITAPELPATTLAYNCYGYMFYGTNVLPDYSNIDFTSSSVVASRGLQNLFSGTKVTDSDLEELLPKNTNGKYFLPITTLVDGCYEGMFSGCTSLTTAPELPATTLTDSCYESMFYGCTNLITAPALPATTLVDSCYRYMFSGCTSLTTAPDLPSTTLASRCYEYMFNNCTNLTTAPELPATTLESYCYKDMFYGCKKLNYIKMLATDISASSCLSYWAVFVSSTGTLVKNPAMTSLPTATSSNSYSGIPSGWTVVNDGEESGSNLITFTIDSTEYQAEKGMTWGEWVDSEYNMGDFAHNGINFVGSRVCDVSGNQINDNTILHDGDFYSLLHNPDGDY